ncbi:MAG: hypothetical protein V8K32_00465 [Candidatus Electrothrix gigas]
MADIVNESKNNNIIKLCGESRFAKYIKDEELRFIDQLLDNEIINRLLAYEGYSPAMRDLFSHNEIILACDLRKNFSRDLFFGFSIQTVPIGIVFLELFLYDTFDIFIMHNT